MKEFNSKEQSSGLGDTIAKITNKLGLDILADRIAKLFGKEDCGCNRRRKKLNNFIPYKSKANDKKIS